MDENQINRELESSPPPPISREKEIRAKAVYWSSLVVLILCCSLLSGCLGVLIGLKMSNNALTLDSIIAKLKANSKDTLPSGQIADAAAATINSVVTVYGHYEETAAAGVSSGVVIAKEDNGQGYLIATCCHGVDGFASLSVATNSGERYVAELKGVDYQTDIALLRINAQDLQVATPRESTPYLGETVIAHGNPLGGVGISTSFGIVSQVSTKVVISGVEQQLIKVDMALNHGNSGGGVFDMENRLIGIASAKVTESNGTMVEGVAYAIPSSTLYTIIPQLKERGFVQNRSHLGINFQIPTEIDTPLTVKEMLYDNDTTLKEGDVIQRVAFHSTVADFGAEAELTHSAALAKFKQLIVNAKEGDTVHITVKRDGAIRTFDLTVHTATDRGSDV